MDSVSIVLAGEAGQGIQAIESTLVSLTRQAGCHVFATKEYMSRVRGGINSTQVIVSNARVTAAVDRIDLLVALDKEALPHLAARIGRDTLIVAEKSRIDDPRVHDLPLSALALEAGSPLYANSAAVGAVCGLLGFDSAHLDAVVRRYFAKKDQAVQDANVHAAMKGFTLGQGLRTGGLMRTVLSPDPSAASDIVLNGAEAVALGALAGGCNMACAYPMSPSTGVLTALASWSRDVDILVEQVEDEVGVMNMALGAWYAGARPLVTTSGGGFALMTEAISLAGMIESPAVVHLAQRPGPATGLPTRTEQGDLNLVLYAGHGDFPRAIYAPGSLEEAFHLAREAFITADACQVPAFVLTDQYFVDSYYNIPMPDVPEIPALQVALTAPGYKRFALTPSGLSPRGIPGHGKGLVKADSDEHSEEGLIVEDAATRAAMVDKRLRKEKLVTARCLPPRLYGPENCKNLLVAWGSTRNALSAALAELPDTALLHFTQVWPIHPSARRFIEKAARLVLVEGNATGQFGALLEQHCGARFDRKVLRYDGRPFTVDGLVSELRADEGR